MTPTALHHASIRITDLARSIAFYEGLLGLQPIARPDLGIAGRWYGIGGGQLHLIQGEAPGTTALDPTGPHFAVAVTDLDAARRELAAAGVETLDPGGSQLWLRDPDGYVVELTTAPV
jgi:catechol 2,3-dioxygenase-like lactoylglutathione lyase family enzyme